MDHHFPISVQRNGKTTWGAVSTSLRRMVSAAYADGKGVPRGGWLSATDSCPKGGIMKFFLKNYVF